MDITCNIQIPKEVWCIGHSYKAEKVYVKKCIFPSFTEHGEFSLIDHATYEVDKYDEPENSCIFTVKANRCFTSKQELLNSL